MKPTDTGRPDHFHKVVSCQWTCPAHTPVPEYIRLTAEGRYADAYMINWQANVFPGVLGRVCDRPCESACRRMRVEDGQSKEPVAICRLKRVAADNTGDIRARLPEVAPANGKRIACIGAGPASLTVARDLAPLGYQVTVFDGENKAGGFMRSQIPKFRLPDTVLDEETGYVLGLGVAFRAGERIDVTPKEYAVLEYLMRHAGKVMSRTLITEYAWGYHFDPGTNIVDVVINHLRKKVDARHERKLINTVRGVGYVVKG